MATFIAAIIVLNTRSVIELYTYLIVGRVYMHERAHAPSLIDGTFCTIVVERLSVRKIIMPVAISVTDLRKLTHRGTSRMKYTFTFIFIHEDTCHEGSSGFESKLVLFLLLFTRGIYYVAIKAFTNEKH